MAVSVLRWTGNHSHPVTNLRPEKGLEQIGLPEAGINHKPKRWTLNSYPAFTTFDQKSHKRGLLVILQVLLGFLKAQEKSF